MLQKDLRYRCLLKCLRDKGGWDCFFDLASILKYLIQDSAQGLGLQASRMQGRMFWQLLDQLAALYKIVLRAWGCMPAGCRAGCFGSY